MDLTMSKYKILAVVIVLVCVIVSSAVIIVGYEKSKELNAYQTNLYLRGNGSAPVDLLSPSTTNSVSGSTSDVYRIVIPRMGVNAKINSETVNGYNTVYHYPESVEPGQNGECGLLSHRTHYSGLFRQLGSLKVGDQVIIKDYTISKKYIYKVTSNGDDIRWDYKENPISFAQSGEPRLLLITCYPPGRKLAAYIVHCKLVSTTSLT
ncbi:class E sortase [Methanobacterium veterum]|jgi:sortase A|uniref:Sortase n=2 Tax=Methanobacterium veterum TaxID=408577 RepID=A0A9E5A6J3_9EURY|nr:sortase [Methanobacterium veterum]MCZ3372528.1 sortase [Methanobacterium veterum]